MDEEKKREEGATPLIHTFQSDANKYIKEKNISLTDIALKEKVKHKSGEIKKNKTAYFIIPLILIALIFTATVGYNKFLKNRHAQEKKETYTKPFIFSDEVRLFEMLNSETDGNEGKNLAKSVKNALSQKYKKNSFVYAIFTQDKKQIETEEFFNFLKISANPEFIKSLEKEFNINIYTNSEGKNNLILVFKTKSFKKSYRGMFDLEKNILSDLSAVLPERAKETPAPAKEATSTPKTASLAEPFLNFAPNNFNAPQGFTDKTINNINARVLKDESGTALIYGFFGEKYLIITNSEETFKKGLERIKISFAE